MLRILFYVNSIVNDIQAICKAGAISAFYKKKMFSCIGKRSRVRRKYNTLWVSFKLFQLRNLFYFKNFYQDDS